MDKIVESENSSIVIAGGWGVFLNIRIIINKNRRVLYSAKFHFSKS